MLAEMPPAPGVEPTPTAQALYLDFVEADDAWRRSIVYALAICTDAVADDGGDSEVREVHGLLAEAAAAAEELPSLREGCRLQRGQGRLPQWWEC